MRPNTERDRDTSAEAIEESRDDRAHVAKATAGQAASPVIDDDDDGPHPFPRPGATLDSGRIVLQRHLRGRLWAGLAGQRPVLVAHRAMSYRQARAAIDAHFRFEAPGVARLEFLGYPDDGGAEVAISEALPAGQTVFDLAPLPAHTVTRCGVALCDTLMAWAARVDDLLEGVRPETMFLHDGVYSGITPRIGVVGSSIEEDTFERVAYSAPSEGSLFYLTLEDQGFIVAQVLWFALLREHPYRLPDAPDERQNIWHDRRRPFTGPRELGEILEAMLVADRERRITVPELRDRLARVANQQAAR